MWDLVARQIRPLERAQEHRVPEAGPDAEPGAEPGVEPGADAPQPRHQEPGAPAPRAAVSPAALLAGARRPGQDDAGFRRLPTPPEPSRVTLDLHDPAPAPVGRPEAGLDRRTAERLRRGERAPDARIDLHGMTAERAHRALDRFIADAAARGLRCVLVITGKGGRGGDDHDAGFMRPDRGRLRQDAPRWLRAGPAARMIVGIYAAHRRHGGEGAFYVYLKKHR